MPIIDLHSHSRFSDGAVSISELIYTYNKAGVEMMSLTDHDCILGLEEAKYKAEKNNILFVDGVEISTCDHDNLHFVGYNFDPKNSALLKLLENNAALRLERVKKTIKLLQENKIKIREEEVLQIAKGVSSRAHIADCLRRRKLGYMRSDIFKKYLGKGCPAYVPPMAATVKETIETIRQAGGKCFIAHPGLVKEHWDFEKWVSWGLDGIEVYYPSHREAMREELLQIAKKYNLLVSGGSDFHGNIAGRTLVPGREVPQEVYDKLYSVFF